MAGRKTKFKTLAQTKAEARTLAARGNDQGWKVVAGKVVGNGKAATYAIMFQPEPRREAIGPGQWFEPVAAYASRKPNPTPADQLTRRVKTDILKRKVAKGGIFFGENHAGRPLSVGPYKEVGSKPGFAVFVGNTPVKIGSASDAVAQFMALAKPGSVRASPTTGEIFENPVCGCGGVRDNPVCGCGGRRDNPLGWRTPVRPAPGAKDINWAKVAELVNNQLAAKVEDIYAAPSKSNRTLTWFKRYAYSKAAGSISRTKARDLLFPYKIDLDKMVDEAINASFGEYALNPTRRDRSRLFERTLLDEPERQDMLQIAVVDIDTGAVEDVRFARDMLEASHLVEAIAEANRQGGRDRLIVFIEGQRAELFFAGDPGKIQGGRYAVAPGRPRGLYATNPTREVPELVERYFQEAMQQPGMIEAQAWAIAWSRYCKYSEPGSSHCKLRRSEYFPGKGGKGSEGSFKCKPTQIKLELLEGPDAPESKILTPSSAGTDLFKRADKVLKEWAMRVPANDMFKVNAEVTFSDASGQIKGGFPLPHRVDLTRKWAREEGLSKSIKGNLTFTAGLGAPASMTPQDYAKYLGAIDPEGNLRSYAADMLESCDLGPGRPNLPTKLPPGKQPSRPSQGPKKPSSRRKSGSGRSSTKKASKGKSGRAKGDRLKGGLGDAGTPIGVDPKQLEMGIKVEMAEHSRLDPDLAREIANDHLTEDPNYYTKLATIENEKQGKFEIRLQAALRTIAKFAEEQGREVDIVREPDEGGPWGFVRVLTRPIGGGQAVSLFFVEKSTGDMYLAKNENAPLPGVVASIFDPMQVAQACRNASFPRAKKPSPKKPSPKAPSGGIRARALDRWEYLNVGESLENATWRIHRYMDTLRMTHLVNAGKRGKKVIELTVHDPQAKLIRDVLQAATRGVTLEEMTAILPTTPMVSELRGIDVETSIEQEINEAGIGMSVSASPSHFHVVDLKDPNLTTLIAPRRAEKTAIKAFYAWAKANRDKIKSMRFADVTRALHESGIDYHQYCAMD